MMQRYVVIGGANLLVALVIAACSGQTDAGARSDAGDGGPTDAPARSDSRVWPETGTMEEGCGFCYDSSSSATLVFQDTQLDQGVCTDAQIEEFFDACFKAGPKQPSCEAFVGQKDASVVANTACINCIFPFYNPNLDVMTAMALPSPAFVLGGTYILANQEACRLKVADAPANCGKKATDALYCRMQTCKECSDACLDECLSLANKDVCNDTLPEAACDAAYTANKAAADAKCGGGANTFEAIFRPLAKAFCGTP